MEKPETNQKEEQSKEKSYPLRVAFIHPDLGIGGAEQLMVNLALTCQKLGWYVKMTPNVHFLKQKTELCQ